MLITILQDILVYRRSLIIIITPIILLVFPLKIGPVNGMQNEMNCAFVVLLMAIYWMTEAIPIPVTSLLPIFLFPALGILPSKDTTMQYFKDTNLLFFAGLMVAAAVEHSNLHKRIALRVLLWVGAKPRWLMLGFMCVTCFLSMWISNTATTAMMVPIALAVLDALFTKHPKATPNKAVKMKNLSSNNEPSTDAEPITVVEKERKRPKRRRHAVCTQTEMEEPKKGSNLKNLSRSEAGITKAVLLSISYAANVGGTGTLTGTGPNLVFRGILDTLFENEDTGITFASWMPFAIPPMIVCLLVAWLWLQFFFFGVRETLSCFRRRGGEKGVDHQHEQDTERLLRQQYDALGPIRFAEISVFVWFLLLVALWIFRDPKFIAGWGSLFRTGYMTDASIGMLIACLLFAWPDQLPDFYFFRSRKHDKATRRGSLLTWKIMQYNFSWGVIILLGGGFALAKGADISGLSKALGTGLGNGLKKLSPAGIAAVFVIIITFLTEVSSNTATASIFIPILCKLAVSICVNPLYFALPVTIACSFAFMIPVGTPPNAIVYEQSNGLVTMKDMIVAGFVTNLLCIIVTLININTYAAWLFDLHSIPAWALANTNASTCLNHTGSS